jgi:hypothetical protein
VDLSGEAERARRSDQAASCRIPCCAVARHNPEWGPARTPNARRKGHVGSFGPPRLTVIANEGQGGYSLNSTLYRPLASCGVFEHLDGEMKPAATCRDRMAWPKRSGQNALVLNGQRVGLRPPKPPRFREWVRKLEVRDVAQAAVPA